jgi:regulator of sirC expression with transglutaminase-like and TPR domain
MAEQSPEQSAQQRAYRAFEMLVTGDDEAIDLARGALLIAMIEYPDLDEAAYLNELDALARRVRLVLALPPPEMLAALPEGIQPLKVLEAMNVVLFEQDHFHGNQRDYYSSANSFLNKVLEERTGIPITLSLLYIEVGRRVGLPLVGIGLPFHFVVGCRMPQGGMLYIDPFEQGRFMSEHDCRLLVRRMAGGRGRFRFQAAWFKPVSKKQFLQRMLTNLKHIYLRSESYKLALAVCDRLLLLAPTVPFEWRDRGIIHLQLKHYGRALRDLKTYLELAPQAEDREEMLRHIQVIRQAIAMLN